ncbi:MAG: 2-amino-4-hydroxy-6-hydroxymethyldihydropteridine diphosphokinase [Deltaproteobacteria bacterium]|nr:2-amino-4-hydroxy-6-hydroxymethyldihydropteridine diphosphokinase [Deltaproteobacteria bacterium]
MFREKPDRLCSFDKTLSFMILEFACLFVKLYFDLAHLSGFSENVVQISPAVSGNGGDGRILSDTFSFRYILAFGSNLGDRVRHCQHGLDLLKKTGLVQLLALSPLIETSPMKSDYYDSSLHGDYVNFLADISTDMTPDLLYQYVSAIEDQIGHSRAGKWLPRELDIDLLLWSRNSHQIFDCCQSLNFTSLSGSPAALSIPHQDLNNRKFLLDLMGHMSPLLTDDPLQITEAR